MAGGVQERGGHDSSSKSMAAEMDRLIVALMADYECSTRAAEEPETDE